MTGSPEAQLGLAGTLPQPSLLMSPCVACIPSPLGRLHATRLAAVLALALAAAPAPAQLVTPRTVPVFQDEQFEIYPSSRPGFAGVFIALDDTLNDPFVNPAKGTRLRGLTITTAPYSHGISGNRGGGRTLPIGFLAGSVVTMLVMAMTDFAGPNNPVKVAIL